MQVNIVLCKKQTAKNTK